MGNPPVFMCRFFRFTKYIFPSNDGYSSVGDASVYSYTLKNTLLEYSLLE